MRWYDRCLRSLLSSDVPLEIVVFDNASTDNSVKYIKDNYPEVYIMESSVNLGFTKANNIAIKYAIQKNADYIFLLNQDAWIERNTISHLLSTFKSKKNVGIVSPVNFNSNKTGLDMYFASFMPWTFVSDAYFNSTKDLYEVQFINATAWLISNDCIQKVGGFDTSLFEHYGEDGNYCQRVIYHGYKIYINANSFICHDKDTYESNYEFKEDQIWAKKDKYHVRKLAEANILEERNIPIIIKSRIRSKYLNIILLRFKKATIIDEEISFLRLINKSREMNLKGGLVWLDLK